MWAYRERPQSADCPFEQVEFLQMAAKGSKCLVRFVDRNGREDWVPQRRLIVGWDDHEAWLVCERRMVAAVEVSAHAYETPQFDAVVALLESWEFVQGIELGWHQNELCTVQIANLEGVCRQLGMDPADLRREPLAFTEEGGRFIAPWSLAVKLARRVAELNGEAIMAKVVDAEYEIQLQAVHGETVHHGRGNKESFWIPPDRLKEEHDKRSIAMNTIREWCGREVLERLDELDALREEVQRLGLLVERAIAELRRCGQTVTAATMESDLGVPVSRLALPRRRKQR